MSRPPRHPGLPSVLPLVLALVAASGAAGAAGPAPPPLPDDEATLRAWVEAMRESPRGPFERIRWFCEDGTVLPPRPYACADHGGGVQHGEWSDRVRALRAGGYRVANVLAALDGSEFTGPDADLEWLRQLLVERFLVRADEGWIFHGARTYRGALQAEDEQAGARRVVRAMLEDPAWREPERWLLLRETVRLLPRATDVVSAAEVRQLALDVAAADPAFEPLRAKIHNAPDATDAGRVRDHAAARGVPAARALYEELASAIDALYTARGAPDVLRDLAARLATADDEGPAARAAATLRRHAGELEAADAPAARLAEAARLLAFYRDRITGLGGTGDPAADEALLEASLALEDEAYAAGGALDVPGATRRTRLAWLRAGARALYGAGFLSRRHLDAVGESLARLEAPGRPVVSDYRAELRYLARGPEWAGRWLAFHTGRAVERLDDLDPLARLYPQDRLRGSPLLLYSRVVDGLVADANRLAGIRHRVFARTPGAGLRALNPGLARGTLRDPGDVHALEHLRRDGIYLLPETVSELPPVSGILTRGEGSSLSHVQLLARNLGIPNVVVGEEVLPAVAPHVGRPVVLAVSHGGVVQLVEDRPAWDRIFGEEGARADEDVVIRPDLEKLDLSVRRMVPLSELRATDSGRISGPKGANLGELAHHFGEAVPDGFVIPFGVFRALLDRPLEPGGPAVWDWMRERYAALEGREGAARDEAVSAFLARLRDWIVSTDPGPDFREELVAMLRRRFGPDGSYGVFVRSDTNVEDLPGFTGAGLNLTVPNVVGEPQVLDAVQRVWASPFTERAWGWRQAHMERPEYVFPAVVVQRAVPADKSGVMVTVDVDTGSREWLSIAANEGVGGAVEGQAAESLRVRTDGGEVRFLARATAPLRTELAPGGGVVRRSASGTSAVLAPDEIARLVDLARRAPRQFPALRPADGDGPPLPADIEFAFADGELAILQLRPFVESRGARESRYLRTLDAGLDARGGLPVDLDAVPPTSTPGAGGGTAEEES